jgi:hypothetical protein
MDIEKIRLNMPLVTSGDIQGKVVAITKEGGLWLETADRRRFPVHVECVKEVSSPCEGCDAIETVVDLSIALGKARRELDEMSDTLPIAAVAKCYKQVEPEQLLMSQKARRVVEYLRASDRPLYIHLILEGMERIMSGTCIMDGLIEAKEAGIVRLDDGKYSIVRD